MTREAATEVAQSFIGPAAGAFAIRRQVVRGDVLTGKVTWTEAARMLAILRKTRETTGRQGDVNSAAQDTTE